MRRPGADQRRLLERLPEAERAVLVEEAGVEVDVADHRDVDEPDTLGRLQPQPQAVRILDLLLALDRRRRDPDRLERTAAEPARLRARPLEERHEGAGAPGVVTEVEVVAVRIVEVDGLLHERETQLAVEVERPLRIGADTGDVVQALELHGQPAYESRRKSSTQLRKKSTATSAVMRVRLRSTMCVPP